VYGDDTIAGLDLFDRFPEDIKQKVEKWLGMTLDPFEISTFTSNENQEQNANFLQTYDYYGLPGRDLNTVIRLLALPKKNSTSYVDNAYKITGTIYTGPGNYAATQLICDYRDWLRWRNLPDHYRASGECPLPNYIGEDAMRISMRISLINYLKTNVNWVGDKATNVMWWLNKESYSPKRNSKFEMLYRKAMLNMPIYNK